MYFSVSDLHAYIDHYFHTQKWEYYASKKEQVDRPSFSKQEEDEGLCFIFKKLSKVAAKHLNSNCPPIPQLKTVTTYVVTNS